MLSSWWHKARDREGEREGGERAHGDFQEHKPIDCTKVENGSSMNYFVRFFQDQQIEEESALLLCSNFCSLRCSLILFCALIVLSLCCSCCSFCSRSALTLSLFLLSICSQFARSAPILLSLCSPFASRNQIKSFSFMVRAKLVWELQSCWRDRLRAKRVALWPKLASPAGSLIAVAWWLNLERFVCCSHSALSLSLSLSSLHNVLSNSLLLSESCASQAGLCPRARADETTAWDHQSSPAHGHHWRGNCTQGVQWRRLGVSSSAHPQAISERLEHALESYRQNESWDGRQWLRGNQVQAISEWLARLRQINDAMDAMIERGIEFKLLFVCMFLFSQLFVFAYRVVRWDDMCAMMRFVWSDTCVEMSSFGMIGRREEIYEEPVSPGLIDLLIPSHLTFTTSLFPFVLRIFPALLSLRGRSGKLVAAEE